MRLYLSRLHFPVTTLGPGRRVGVWFQGCSLRCPGCVSVDTWAVGQGETTLAEVLTAIGPWLSEADGITISGGEPFDQSQALGELLRSLRALAGPATDVLVYSGYPWEKIASQVTAWSGLVDALISDPFDPKTGQTLVWRGSDNQRMHLLTSLSRSRYAKWFNAPRSELPQALDVFFQDGEVWMAGIPAAGTMEGIKSCLADAGFSSSNSLTSTSATAGFPVFA
jgi:anaerobic ribonucleoside-triphosphate reductase activating protein